jgi:creatinine amidohydrolase
MSEAVSVMWGDHTWEELEQLAEASSLVVLPCGATEQHGPAMTVDTDSRIAEKITIAAAEKVWAEHGVRALVLPTLHYGVSAHHTAYAGTITIDPQIYVSVVCEVLTGVVDHGFRKIAVVSGHGGNIPALEVACRHVADEYRHLPVRISLDRMSQVPPWFQEIIEELPDEGGVRGHADLIETSLMLADRTEKVRRDRIRKPKLKVDREPDWEWLTHELTDNGVIGDPTQADAELGQRIWDGAIDDFCKRLQRLWTLDLA